MQTNPQQEIADLVTFAEEIFNGKLYILCSFLDGRLNLNSHNGQWFVSTVFSLIMEVKQKMVKSAWLNLCE